MNLIDYSTSLDKWLDDNTEEIDTPPYHVVPVDVVEDKLAELAEALRDAVAGYKYIEDSHGRLYGVGFDRIYDKAKKLGIDEYYK
jgi:hypothetical protein